MKDNNPKRKENKERFAKQLEALELELLQNESDNLASVYLSLGPVHRKKLYEDLCALTEKYTGPRKLREARIEANLKTKELAALVGYSQSYISQVESGKRTIPKEGALRDWYDSIDDKFDE